MQSLSYKSVKAISQSAIKQFRYMSPKKWKSIWIDNQKDDEGDKDAFILGSLLDLLLFTPKELETHFYIGSVEKMPSDPVKYICLAIYTELNRKNEEIVRLNKEEILPETLQNINIDLEEHSNLIITYADMYVNDKGEKGWCSTMKEETRIKRLIDQGTNYFDSLVKANGRQVITSELNMQALELVDILKKDPITKDYFIESEGNELLFQLELTGEIKEGITVKGALDLLRINHLKKTIQIADFKKAHSAYQFLDNAKKFDYCGQLSYYSYLLNLCFLQNLRPELKGYEILLPINIVIDVIDKQPYIYEYNQVDLDITQYGNSAILYELFRGKLHPFKIKKGWQEILQEIAWHMNTNQWDKPKELYETGKIKLNLLNM